MDGTESPRDSSGRATEMRGPGRGFHFFTAAEVAAILKVNHQVLARKLQQGEIPAYKIGKDWRIEESELRAWLTTVSNRAAAAKAEALHGAAAEEESIRRNFFVANRLTTIPARRSKREVVLRILARRFEPGRTYREAEVNEILRGAHPDFCTLRRELVMARLLQREKGRYWRPSSEATVPKGKVEAQKRSAASGRSAATAPRAHT